MKHFFGTLLLFAILTLCGCASHEAEDMVTISIIEEKGCTVVNNGQKIPSGENAAFELELDPGYILLSVEYDGDYTIIEDDRKVSVELQQVLYPDRIKLNLTNNYCNITYHANNGNALPYTKTYDLTHHIRPNTSIGTDIFKRKGYTLIGWNTEPDGSGISVGLGSRISVPENELNLYAQWLPWSQSEMFNYTLDEFVTITGYMGDEDIVVIPGEINGVAVNAIASDAFVDCLVNAVVFPLSMRIVNDGAFRNCSLRELRLYDSISYISDSSFVDCDNLTTLYINAIEAPYGYEYRRESCYADKVDLLIEAQGQKKIIFYGGCSMWYNLDGYMAQEFLGHQYRVVNMGLNGVVSSAPQMQILTHFVESGDIFFHTPELSSETQLLISMEMIQHDAKLWSGWEYNYDLVSLIDLRDFPNFLDCFHYWLSIKKEISSYEDYYTDRYGREFLDIFGGIPFEREISAEKLVDDVFLDPIYINEEAMAHMEEYYQAIADQGAKIYISYACINLDGLPEEQRGNVMMMDTLFHDAIDQMDGPTIISELQDYLFQNEDFYDTNYHMLTSTAQRNTGLWLRDLYAQLLEDGLWEVDG